MLSSLFILSIPFVVSSAPATFKDLVQGPSQSFTSLFNNAVIPLIFALAFITFLWGIFQYMFFPDNEEKLRQGKNMIVFGLIGIFIMAVVWGLVSIVSKSLFG